MYHPRCPSYIRRARARLTKIATSVAFRFCFAAVSGYCWHTDMLHWSFVRRLVTFIECSTPASMIGSRGIAMPMPVRGYLASLQPGR